MLRSTGLAKKLRQVSTKPGAAPVAAAGDDGCAGAGSSPPLRGSRMKHHTPTAVSTPTTPTQRKAMRHEYAAATEAPKATPIAAPIGGPRLNSPSAVPRVPGGKEAVMIAYEGGTPPASPTPTAMRASASCG